MLNPSECRARAKECVALARFEAEERRHYLLKMARIWRGLARDRELARNRQIDEMLKAAFDTIAREPVPEAIYSLLGRLEAAEQHDALH